VRTGPRHGGLLLLVLSLAWLPTRGLAAEPLPDPLTLEQALALSVADHPNLRRAAALRDRERAYGAAAQAVDDPELLLRGRLRWIDPPSAAGDDDHDDHWAGLFLRKRLYDFGYSEALGEAGRYRAEAGQWSYLASHRLHRLQLLEDFFAVLRADLAYAWRNEALATAFVTFDRARERRDLGQRSDLEVLELESANADALRALAEADARRRATRQRLAQVLNRPDSLPGNLESPRLSWLDRERPKDEQWLATMAVERNPRLRALRARVAAAEASLVAARSIAMPRFNGEVELSEYSRETRTRDPVRAGVYVEIPLYRGGRDAAEVATRVAALEEARAELAADEFAVRQAVLESWQALRVLQLQRDAASTRLDYRELYLDRSRALYEQEVRSDLGDAMVRFSEARLRAAETDHRLALTWERLDALTDGALLEIGTPSTR